MDDAGPSSGCHSAGPPVSFGAVPRSLSRPVCGSVKSFYSNVPDSPSGAGLYRALEQLMLRNGEVMSRVQASMKGISSLAKETTTLQLGSDAQSGATLINQYVLVKTLGRGSFGKVKLCLNTMDGQMYAVKMINRAFVLRQLQRPVRGLLRKRSVVSSSASFAVKGGGASVGGGGGGGGMVTSSSWRQSLDETRRSAASGFGSSGCLHGSPLPIGPLESVMREIAVLKRLDHPNVVRLREVIDPPGSDYMMLVMDYMENGPVLETTSQNGFGRFSEDVARDYFRQVCCGLDYLHLNSVVHGDLKPENLLLTHGGTVLKIGDFGSSRILNDVHANSRVSGTPAFQSPEAVLGGALGADEQHAFAGDVWALGGVLYCLVYGRTPFQGASPLDVSRAILQGDVELPAAGGGGEDGEMPASDDLLDLLRRIFVADPEQRITLRDVMRHDWTTRRGTLPVPEAHQRAPIEVTRGQAMLAIDRSLASLICAKLKEHTFGPGDYVFRTHDEAHCVFMIMSGVVEMLAARALPKWLCAGAGGGEGGEGEGEDDLSLDIDESFILEFGVEVPPDSVQKEGKVHFTSEQAAMLRQRMSDMLLGRGEEYVVEVRGPGQVIGELSLDDTRVTHYMCSARAKTDVVAVKLTEESLIKALTTMYETQKPATGTIGAAGQGLSTSELGSRQQLPTMESLLSLLSDDVSLSSAYNTQTGRSMGCVDPAATAASLATIVDERDNSNVDSL
uniref:cGMP-dependent protein kinase n=1 Tax=Chlamydomonas euryale TaxID=1486919 RepID=A0A7R9YVV4_9CHLO